MNLLKTDLFVAKWLGVPVVAAVSPPRTFDKIFWEVFVPVKH